MDSKSVGFIGVGNMGGAILNGILSQNILPSNLIHLFDSNQEISKNPSFSGCHWFSNEDELYCNSDIIFLCIKPQGFLELLNKLKKYPSDDKPVYYTHLNHGKTYH